jgi:dTDP-4-dehydrorhamnose 3,5-epimerase
MIIAPAALEGVFVIEAEKLHDHRGYFARVWCEREFAEHHLPMQIVQASIAYSRAKGTLRGLHYQAEPHGEIKLVRCTRGAAYVVLVDLRPDSPTAKSWIGVELSAENARGLYVPKGVAQGYQTLADDTELYYQMSHVYVPEAARGVRFDDPALAIRWPLETTVISDRDRSWPDYAPPSSRCR